MLIKALVTVTALCLFPCSVIAQDLPKNTRARDLQQLDFNQQQQEEIKFGTTVTANLADIQSAIQLSQGNFEEISNDQGFYLGGTLGLFFPDFNYNRSVDLDTDNGFGGSAFLGYQFTRQWAVDLDVVLFGGNSNITNRQLGVDLDGDYSIFSVLVGPRFMIPLGDQNQDTGFSLFLSPGIGLGKVNVNIGNRDSSQTTFAFQVKGGFGYKFTPQVELLLQGRYLSLTGDEDFNSFSPELGLRFLF